MQSENSKRDESERASRLSARRQDFQRVYKSEHPHGLMGVGCEDASHLPSVCKLLEERDCYLTVSEEQWHAIEPLATAEIAHVVDRIQRDFIAVATGASSQTSISKASLQVADQISSLTTPRSVPEASKAILLMNCGDCNNAVLCADAMSHASIECNQNRRWRGGTWPPEFSYSNVPHLSDVASLLLEAVGLSSSALDVSRRIFKCTCGNPDFLNPMKFGDLVRNEVACLPVNRYDWQAHRCPMSSSKTEFTRG